MYKILCYNLLNFTLKNSVNYNINNNTSIIIISHTIKGLKMASFSSLPPPPGETFYQDSVDVFLTESNTWVETKNYARLNIYSDSTTASDRQIQLAPSDLEGQQITLILLSGDDTTCLLSTLSTSYVRLEAAWTPLQYDQLTLQWTKGLWIEIGRSSAGTGGFNPDIENPQPGDIIIYGNDNVWHNKTTTGEISLSADGDFQFRYTNSPAIGEVLTYDGAHWTNSSSAFVWEALTIEPNYTGSAHVAVMGNLLVFRGSVTAQAGHGNDFAVCPVSMTGGNLTLTVGSFDASTGFSPAVQIDLNCTTGVFTKSGTGDGDIIYLDGICISRYNA